MNKLEVLKTALTAREEEIAGYQINIDNYTLAIKQIEEKNTTDSDIDVALREFSVQLQTLLQQHLVEQAKTQVIYHRLHNAIAKLAGNMIGLLGSSTQ